MIKALVLFYISILLLGCSSISNSLKKNQDLISGNIELVKNIGMTYDSGGYLKEAAKAQGKPHYRLTTDDIDYEIPRISSSLKTLKNTKKFTNEIINISIGEYESQKINENQEKRISILKRDLNNLNKLLDINISKGVKLLTKLKNN